jgi:hypothetical protein
MSIRVSSESAEILRKLQRALRIERPPLVRLAFAVGLRHCNGTLPTQGDSKGVEVPMKVITFGKDGLFDSTIIDEFGDVLVPFDSGDRRRVYKCLVDHGLGIMASDFEGDRQAVDVIAQMARKYFSG